MSQLERYNRGGIGRWYWDYRDREIIKLIPPGKVLDVGCGEMITTRKIPGAIGMDLDQGDVRGSVYNIPYPDNYFDCVTLLEVIEHLLKPWAALGEVYRVLKPGGRIVMLFPHDRIIKICRLACGMWDAAGADSGHVWQWTPKTARAGLFLMGYNHIYHNSIPFRLWPLSLHHIIVGEKC